MMLKKNPGNFNVIFAIQSVRDGQGQEKTHGFPGKLQKNFSKVTVILTNFEECSYKLE